MDLQKVDTLLKATPTPTTKTVEPTPTTPTTPTTPNRQTAEALAFIEFYFWEKGKLPSSALLKMKGLDVDVYSISEQLEARNLPVYPPVGKKTDAVLSEDVTYDGLDPMFMLACNRVMNVNDVRSLATKLKDVGLTVGQWNAFLADPVNQKYAKERISNLGTSISINAQLGLGKAVATGDLNAIKYYHEFSGEFRPGAEEALNLKMVIMVLMEILVRFVDPKVMPQIADELEGALNIKGAIEAKG